MTKFTDYLYDLIQNSISAKANNIKLTLKHNGLLRVTLEDDGIGMDFKTLALVRTFNYTSRTKRSVGLGLSFVYDLATQTNGYFNIDSTQGVGTILSLGFDHHHIDFPEFGDIYELVLDIYMHQDVINFRLEYNDLIIDFDELKLTTLPKTFKQRTYLKETMIEAFRRGGYENS
jgi:DNA mismatch repair ATPase MutL